MAATLLGEALLAPVERALAQIDQLLELDRFDPGRSERHFRLALPSVLGLVFTPIWGRTLEATAPGISFQMLSVHAQSSAALLNGDVDLLVGGSVIDHPEVFNRTIPTPMDWAVVGGTLSDVTPSMGVEAWAAAPHVQFVTSGRPDTRGRFDALLREHHGLTRRIVAKLEHVSAVGPLLASTRLVASLPRPVAVRIAALHDLTITEHPLADVLTPLTVRMSLATSGQSRRRPPLVARNGRRSAHRSPRARPTVITAER